MAKCFIVEAMKIMNEIEAEVSGEIVEVCVENETYVEFGQTLLKLNHKREIKWEKSKKKF